MGETKLHNPWLVAVWPGMGHVAMSAGYFLMAKLGMELLAEFEAHALFEVEHVEVKDGLIQPGPLPRSRLFAWRDPRGKHDIVLFLGEAQPPLGRHAFCHRLIEEAKELGVERVFTFAAMATPMRPEHDSRVFGAATSGEGLKELTRFELHLLEGGYISGLNGVLLGVAAEEGLPGTCLLGEMPHVFAKLPFPKASLAVLEVFTTIAGIELDLGELSEQARVMEQRLGDLLTQIEQAVQQGARSDDVEAMLGDQRKEQEGLGPEDEKRIEALFAQAREDRSKSYELKRELDRLGVFREYEDRFLDLFQKPT